MMLRLSDQDIKHLNLLFTPSWLSGLVCIIAGLVVSVGVIVVFTAHNSQIQQQITAWQQTAPPPASSGQASVGGANSTLQNSWPLFIFWGIVGLVVYFTVANIIRFLANVEMFRESLSYVHADPQAMLKSMTEHIALRLIAAIILIGLMRLFMTRLLPYSITAAHASAADLLSWSGGLYALLSFAMVALSLHVQVIFLRLAMGRSRVFLDI